MATDNSTASTPRRNRRNCIVPDCPNQAYARQLCCRHGAKKKCSVPGCDLRARTHGICFTHGAPKSRCDEPGCNHPAQARKKCIKHGGGRRCTAHGCTSHARYKGKCQRHTATDTPVDMMALWGTPNEYTTTTTHRRSYSIDSTDDVAAVDIAPCQLLDDIMTEYLEPLDFKRETCRDEMMMEIYSLLVTL
ncbi:hypothetical protein LEN26_019083 [Aphanomyces euteiches]|nr:hypothetical protein LEN26_019083 [Aphanomyces euteiches]KAH9106400.1 hypothetical protein AeMF1_017982 [Aphanomyces euteiches]